MKVLRKLDKNELVKSQGGAGTNFVSTYRIRSKLDLFSKHQSVSLLKSIHTWKSMHKFLQSKINLIDQDYCFVLNEDAPALVNLENVYFLRIISDTNRGEFENSITNLVIEKCFHELIDFKSEYLWRIILIEFDQTSDGEFIYELVLQLHHAIADGLSTNANIVLLLDIIQRTINGEEIEKREFGVFPGTDVLFEKEAKSIEKRLNTPNVFWPSFVDIKREKSASFNQKYKDLENVNFELLDVLTNKIYAKSSDLYFISRELSTVKPNRFCINEELTSKLIKK